MLGGPHDIEEDVYRQDPGINISLLKEMGRSPRKMLRSMQMQRKESPAQALGKAMHMAILEPEKFLSNYITEPEGVNKRKKADREALEELRASGKEILSSEDFEACLLQAERIRTSSFFAKMIDGQTETSWFENYHGRRIKGRLDVWLPEKRVIVDIKTTDSADERSFARDAIKYGYHVQAAFYSDLVSACIKEPVAGFAILAIEKTEDRDMRAFWLDPELIEAGRKLYRQWLDQFILCEETGNFPGYPQRLYDLKLPIWMKD